jgi:hypothetical protein
LRLVATLGTLGIMTSRAPTFIHLAAVLAASMACAPLPPSSGGSTDDDGNGSDDAGDDTTSTTGAEGGDGDGDTTTGDGDTAGDGDGSTGDGDGTTGDGDGCSLGMQGCPCFGNGTCFEPHQCVNGTCGCVDGANGCSCNAQGECDAGLSCNGGVCTPGGNADIIACGTGLTCDVSMSEACCWDTYLSEGSPQGECVTGDIASDGCATQQDGSGHETRIECQGSAQCATGELCCGELYDSPMGQNYMQATCETSCGSFTICASDAECPTGDSCNSSNYLPTGYGYCA